MSRQPFGAVEVDDKLLKVATHRREIADPIVNPYNELHPDAQSLLATAAVDLPLGSAQPWSIAGQVEETRQMQNEQRPARRSRQTSEDQRVAAAEIVESVAARLEVADKRGRATSIPKMADDIVRLMAATVLTGGAQFAPTTGKEATEMAKLWSSIRATYRAGAALEKMTETTAKDSTEDVVRHLNDLKQRLEARQVRPGQVKQIVHVEDDD